MKENFLKRDIKQDGKGLFVFYGSIKLRPQGIKQNTAFTKDQRVSVNPQRPGQAQIFTDADRYEIWTRKSERV